MYSGNQGLFIISFITDVRCVYTAGEKERRRDRDGNMEERRGREQEEEEEERTRH